jgi:hypothetical protein
VPATLSSQLRKNCQCVFRQTTVLYSAYLQVLYQRVLFLGDFPKIGGVARDGLSAQSESVNFTFRFVPGTLCVNAREAIEDKMHRGYSAMNVAYVAPKGCWRQTSSLMVFNSPSRTTFNTQASASVGGKTVCCKLDGHGKRKFSAINPFTVCTVPLLLCRVLQGPTWQGFACRAGASLQPQVRSCAS